jgi:hypothetical protein
MRSNQAAKKLGISTTPGFEPTTAHRHCGHIFLVRHDNKIELGRSTAREVVSASPNFQWRFFSFFSSICQDSFDANPFLEIPSGVIAIRYSLVLLL